MGNDYCRAVALGDLLQRRTERGRDDDPLLSVTQDRGVIPQEEAGRRNISSADKSTYWRVYPGDIVYNTMRMWQAASARSDYFGIVSPAYTVCAPCDSASSEYLAYLLKTENAVRKFYARSQGITSDVWNLRFPEFARIELDVIADRHHQQRIVEVLSTVDEAIEQTEALITKTQQIKAGLMRDLFTRGVTADGQLRPPREEAPQLYKKSPLGWIPNEWKSRKFDSLLNGTPQNGLYKPQSSYTPTGVPIARIDSFYGGVLLALDTLRRLKLEPSELSRYVLKTGEILINRVNSIDLVGKSAIVPKLYETLVFESNIMRCRLNTAEIKPEFAILWLCSEEARNHFRSRAKNAVAQASINQQDVCCLLVPQPSLDEQDRVRMLAEAGEEMLNQEQVNLYKIKHLKRGLIQGLLSGRAPAVATPESSVAELKENV